MTRVTRAAALRGALFTRSRDDAQFEGVDPLWNVKLAALLDEPAGSLFETELKRPTTVGKLQGGEISD
jgi:hypothetical protein